MAIFYSRKVKVLVLVFIALFFFHVGYATDPSLKFIENKNQWNSPIQFLAKVPGGEMSVGAGVFQYTFLDQKHLEELHLRSHQAAPDQDRQLFIQGHSIKVSFMGANKGSLTHPFGMTDEYYNYFVGNDPTRWATKVRAYEGILFESFYAKTDLKVYSSGNNLKYDFIVNPGGDPSDIKLKYEGASRLSLDNGNLIVDMSLGQLIEKRPVAFQFIEGVKTDVPIAYSLSGSDLSFIFPEGFDHCYPLIIDPLLIFSTYSGSTADNWGSTATPGEHGTLYSAGVTNQSSFAGTFPVSTGAFQKAYGGEYDIGILKYDSTGSKLLYASFLGGKENESPHSLVMDKNEDLIVFGTTSSFDFPTTLNAFDRVFDGGDPVGHVIDYFDGADIIVSRISKDGSVLIGSTFLGGDSNDGVNDDNSGLVRNYGDQLRGDVITDKEGNILISSVTASADFPVAAGFDLSYNGGLTDAVLVKLNSTLTQILWGTFLGGSGADAAYTVKFDSGGNILAAGGTTSANFPFVIGSYKSILSGSVDGWISRFGPDGKSLKQSTYVGSTSYDQVYFLDLNANDDIYVYGQTNSLNFQVTIGVYSNPSSGQFLQKFDPTLANVLLSTVFGSGRGIPDISPTAFLVNDCNNIYMAGWGGQINSRLGFWNSGTTQMPISNDALQKTSSGSDFYFIVLTEDAKNFLYGTYLGGSQSRTHVDGGTSRFDKGGIVYHAVCAGCKALNATGLPTSDFPTTSGAWSRTNNSGNCNNAAFKFDLSSLKARLQSNSVKLNSPGLNRVCMPDSIVFENLSIGGEIYQWDLGDGTKITKNSKVSITHQYQSAGSFIVKLKAIDQGTCKVVDSTSMKVIVNKSSSYAQGDDQVCEGNSYALRAYGGVAYHWITPDGINSSLASSITVTPRDTSRYVVTIFEKNGCERTDTIQLNVIDAIHPEFEFTRKTNCFDRPILKVKDLTDSLHNEDLIFFTFGDGTRSDTPEAEHSFEKDGIYPVTLTASRNGCVFEKTVDLPFYKFFVPNVITPGKGDGLNDVFFVQVGETKGKSPADFGFKTSLTVHNRWGETVYQTNDYQFDWAGEGLAAGVYFFELTVADQASCRSWVHLIK